jgi:small subunit ribosomal protein S5
MNMAEKNIMRPRGGSFAEKREPKEYEERVIEIARVSRVAKGGRKIRFRALVVLGNKKGKIGMGLAKADEVAEAVKKATAGAKKHIKVVPVINGTIPHEIYAKHAGAKVMLKPAAEGTSIVAGGSVRSVAELAGITDLLAKSMGSSNKVNNVAATIKALTSFNQEIVAKIEEIVKRKETGLVKADKPAETVPVEVEKEEKAPKKPVAKKNNN